MFKFNSNKTAFNSKISTYNFNEIYELACKNLKNNKGKIFYYIVICKSYNVSQKPYKIIY